MIYKHNGEIYTNEEIPDGDVTQYIEFKDRFLTTQDKKVELWFEKDGIKYSTVQKVKVSSGDRPEQQKYTVTYVANGGTGSMEEVSGIVGEYTLLANGFTAPNGKRFKAWRVNGEEKAEGAKIEVTANTTVTAIWEDISTTYTVTFNVNGGSAVDSQLINAGEKAIKPTNPTKNEYIFAGWYTDNTYTIEFDFINTSINSDITIYAKWTKKTTAGGGGGGVESATVTKYEIIVKYGKNGSISPKTVKVEKGENQTFNIKAEKGYEIEDVLIDGKSVGTVDTYTFENVIEKHTIEATFKKVEETKPVEPEEEWENPFIDVAEEDWFYEAVKFANESKLFNGVSVNEFGASTNMTRGMIVTVLYRYAKAETTKEATFDDVKAGTYYSNAIAWAAENGIVNGIGNNNFAPDKSVSREEFVVILYRYAIKNGKDVSVGENTNILSYDDFNQISEYAIPAMQWAVGSGIITGRTNTTLVPKGTATRAEVATMVMRFAI